MSCTHTRIVNEWPSVKILAVRLLYKIVTPKDAQSYLKYCSEIRRVWRFVADLARLMRK